MSVERLAWRVAAPLWDRALGDPGAPPARFEAPALLRFASDAFMDEFQETLELDPDGVGDQVVRPEDWRNPTAGWLEDPAAGSGPVTLYQPVQGRFYLVAANLVCLGPGQPDRRVEARRAERAAFVMRRLVPKSDQDLDPTDPQTYDEYFWNGDRQGGRWLPVADPEALDAKEERLPLFPVGYSQRGRKRRVWAGLVPVGSREAYDQGARESLRKPSPAALGADPLADERIAGFQAGVVKGLETLGNLPDENAPNPDLIRQALVLTSLDLAEFLSETLPLVLDAGSVADLPGDQAALFNRLVNQVAAGHHWLDLARDALENQARILAGDFSGLLATDAAADFTPDTIAGAASALLGAMSDPDSDPGPPYPAYPLVEELAVALGDPRAASAQGLMDDWGDRLGEWPAGDEAAQAEALGMLLGLADYLEREIPPVWQAVLDGAANGLSPGQLDLWGLLEDRTLAGSSVRVQLADAAAHRREILLGEPSADLLLIAARPAATSLRDQLTALIGGTSLTTSLTSALPPAEEVPPVAGPEAPLPPATYYRLRCAYERPRCPGSSRALVSEPSRPFRLASFFEPDAPQRQVHIRMPVDTSLQGLRSYPKNVSVLLSNKLREQMERIQQIRLNDDNEVEVVGDEASFDLGLVCSFSLPIVTIVALIILMIVVQILNIVFFWLPYFVICLPLNLRLRP